MLKENLYLGNLNVEGKPLYKRMKRKIRTYSEI
jgi:hypothetical protein